jgi:hypothetical protein
MTFLIKNIQIDKSITFHRSQKKRNLINQREPICQTKSSHATWSFESQKAPPQLFITADKKNVWLKFCYLIDWIYFEMSLIIEDAPLLFSKVAQNAVDVSWKMLNHYRLRTHLWCHQWYAPKLKVINQSSRNKSFAGMTSKAFNLVRSILSSMTSQLHSACVYFRRM